MESRRPNLLQRATQGIYRMRRRVATCGAILLAVGFGYHAIFGQNGLTAYAEKRSEDRAYSLRIQKLADGNARLQEHVDHLRSDPVSIEHEARERLHYTRPGEVIYTLDDRHGAAADGDARAAATAHPAPAR